MNIPRTASGTVWSWALAALAIVLLAAPAFTQGKTGFDRWKAERQALLADPTVVAYYDFQEGAGDLLKNQAQTGQKLDGKIEKATWTAGRWPAKKALEFDGNLSLVEIPASPLLVPLDGTKGGTGELSFELWLNITEVREAGIMDKSSGGTGGDAPYGLWISPNRFFAYVCGDRNNGIFITGDGTDLTPGQWMHVVMTVTDKTITLYRDGVQVGQTARSGIPADNGRPLLIGAMGRLGLGKFYLCGLVDEVVIYNKALSVEKIKSRAELVPGAWGNGSQTPAGVSVDLLEPNGGEAWDAGSKHYVRWVTRGPWTNMPLKLEYSADGGKTWTAVSTTANRLGRFLWTVPDAVSKEFKVRVSDPNRVVTAESKTPFSVTPSRAVPDYKWISVLPKGPFAARDGAGAIVFKGKMWLIGGWNPGDKTHFPRVCNNEVWSSQDGANWTLVHPNTFLDQTFDPKADWEGRHTAGYVVHQDKMWIVGGDPIQGHYQNDVWQSVDGKTWTCVTSNVPWGPRVLHHTLKFKDRIWVMGGQTLPPWGPAEELFYRDIWASSDGAKWEKVEPKEPFWPQRGMIGGSAVFKGRMWILGGGTYNTPKVPTRKFFNDVWSSEDGVNWQCHVVNAPWDPRQYLDVAVFDDKLWVMEGWNAANRNDVWYSPDGVNWYEVPNTPWAPRHASSAFVHDNGLWMVVGNNMEPDVWKLVRAPKDGK